LRHATKTRLRVFGSSRRRAGRPAAGSNRRPPAWSTHDSRDLLERTPADNRSRYVTKPRRAERDVGCEHLPARRLVHFASPTDAHKKPMHNPHPTVKWSGPRLMDS
jgi:hypothetical protein